MRQSPARQSPGQLLPISYQGSAFAQLSTFQGPVSCSARKAGKPNQGPAEPRESFSTMDSAREEISPMLQEPQPLVGCSGSYPHHVLWGKV